MTYVIQSGDTLSSIARRFNTTVQAILAANPQITNPNLIFVGQVITIPTGTTPPPPVGPCPTLRIGSTGTAVRDLQTRLAARGFSPGPIDGIFGTQTQAAVIAFQRSVGLPATGVVDTATWQALGVNCGIVPPPPPPPPSGICPTLSIGSTGPAVREAQVRLTSRGFSPGPIDGIFGSRTQAAVIAFQRSVGLPATGVINVATWTALGVNCGVVPPPPPPPTTNCPTLRLGSTGPAVRDLQTRLLARGINPGPIDGVFGTQTQAAVVTLQRSVGLPATGVVDVPTWQALGVTCTNVPPGPGTTYVVQPGDTLSSIARRFNVTVQAILAANPQITNPNVIFPGQVLIIPTGPFIVTPGTSGTSGTSGT